MTDTYPLIPHYESTYLDGPRTYPANILEFYALVHKGGNHIQIGLKETSALGLNVHHQPLDNIHYFDVFHIAEALRCGNYRVFDGKLSRRWLLKDQPSLTAEIQRIEINGETYFKESSRQTVYDSQAKRTSVKLKSPNAADLLLRVFAAAFDDPFQGLKLNLLDPVIYGPDDHVIVYFDTFSKRITIGLGLTRDGAKDFLPFFSISRRDFEAYIERWTTLAENDDGICLGMPRHGDVQVSGERLKSLAAGVKWVGDAYWKEPLQSSKQLREERANAWRVREDEVQKLPDPPVLQLGGIIDMLRPTPVL